MQIPLITSSRFVVLALTVVIGCGGGPSAELTIPDTPDGTARVVMQGLTEHQPVILWRALPPSYQQDVAALRAGFVDAVDPAIFDRAVAVARKGVVVLQSKKALILESQTVKNSQEDAESVDAVWEASVHMLDAVLASEAADLVTLRELDIEGFLTTTGASLMDHAASVAPGEEDDDSLSTRLAALEATEVELVSQDGDQATVRIVPPEAEPTDVAMTRIEGRWLPTDFVAQWPGMLEQVNARIDYLGSEDAAGAKVQLLFAIGIAEGFIDQIDQMESSDEVDELIGGLLGGMMQQQGGQMVTEG